MLSFLGDFIGLGGLLRQGLGLGLGLGRDNKSIESSGCVKKIFCSSLSPGCITMDLCEDRAGHQDILMRLEKHTYNKAQYFMLRQL